ncbi:glycosyltransferase family 87 protein [Nesterenkonia marinintestina]|uniref:glycosyltransferase family 87 protein n=1 Tax=Nesterenkonia marinintestina TaxID=2979865 RepID=UPI0021C00273|nr:glycosyltransferase 87 family protein [Nesterenkonia sp. GX14115]
MSATPPHTPDGDVDAPTRSDPLLRSLSDRFGGPAGARVLPARRSRWGLTAVGWVLVALTLLGVLLTLLHMGHCRAEGWGGVAVHHHGCYSDVAALYAGRELDSTPWAPFRGDMWFEYPVLTGLLASVAAVVTQGVAALFPTGETPEQTALLNYWGERESLLFWDVTFVMTAAAWVVLVLAVMRAAGRRPWDAAMVAIAPPIILTAGINWDMWPAAVLALAVLAHLRGRHLTAGVLIGIGTAFKIYPLFMLGAVFVLALRSLLGRDREADCGPAEFLRTLLGAVVAWSAVNVPAMLISFQAWGQFYEFSDERGAGNSSLWHVWTLLADDRGWPAPDAGFISTWSFLLFLFCCLAVLALGVTVRTRPRMVQLLFLIVAAFILVNKVYSPQFVIWLLPLLALAAPRWRDLLIWTVVEVLHFWAIWMHLAAQIGDYESQHVMGEGVFVLAVVAHMLVTVYLMGVVVRDVLRPERDLHPRPV